MAMLIAINSKAALNEQQILMHMKDGTSTAYVFDESTKMRFIQNELYLSTSAFEIIIPIDKIAKFEYVQKSGIESVTNLTSKISVFEQGRIIYIENILTNSQVSAYTINGNLIHSSVAKPGEIATISAETWSPGIYMITVADRPFKIIIR